MKLINHKEIMNKYRIEVKEITTYEADIEAETKEEAINKGGYLAMSSNLQKNPKFYESDYEVLEPLLIS